MDHGAQEPQIGITSLSIGRASVHGMERKIKAAADEGFKGIEIFYEDIAVLAGELRQDESHKSSLQAAAQQVRRLCDSLGLTIINLQPFRDYEGLISKRRHREKVSELRRWFVLCKILRTKTIVVTSGFPSCPPIATGNVDRIVDDFREIADLGAREEPPIRFAYEAISWGSHISTWQQAWSIVQQVDRPNLGLCLDTFHVLATVWASPESTTDRKLTAAESLRRDLQELVSTVRREQLFSIQLADAARPDRSISSREPWYDPSQHPLMTWSRQARLFPLEKERGAYLPVMKVLKACIADLGYKGWISLEVFNESLFDPDSCVPSLHAQRGMRAWEKCTEALNHGTTKLNPRCLAVSNEVKVNTQAPNILDPKEAAQSDFTTKTSTGTMLRIANPRPVA